MTTVATMTPGPSVREAGHLLYLVVLPCLDALRAEQVVQSVARVALMVNPLLDSLKHLAVDLKVVVTDCRMVEYSADIVQDLLLWYIWVIPSIHNARGDVLQNSCSDLTSRLVQNVAEVILGQHGVGRVGAPGVIPNEVLLLSTGINDGAAASLQRVGCRRNDRLDVWRQQAHDE